MNRKSVLDSARMTAMAGLAVLGALAPTAASAAPAAQYTADTVALQCSGWRMTLDTRTDDLGIKDTIESRLGPVCPGKDMGDIAKDLMNTTFDAAGGRYNVLVFNIRQQHEWRHREGQHFYAETAVGDAIYGIWVVEAGEFENKGDGGWNNWAMRGWFDSHGKVVNFHRP